MVGRIYVYSNINYSNIENSKLEYSGTRVLEYSNIRILSKIRIFDIYRYRYRYRRRYRYRYRFRYRFRFRFSISMPNIEYRVSDIRISNIRYSNIRVLEYSKIRILSKIRIFDIYQYWYRYRCRYRFRFRFWFRFWFRFRYRISNIGYSIFEYRIFDIRIFGYSSTRKFEFTEQPHVFWFFGYISMTVQRIGHCNTSIHIASSRATRWETKLDPNPYPLGTGPPNHKSHHVTPRRRSGRRQNSSTHDSNHAKCEGVSSNIITNSDVVFLYTALLGP